MRMSKKSQTYYVTSANRMPQVNIERHCDNTTVDESWTGYIHIQEIELSYSCVPLV